MFAMLTKAREIKKQAFGLLDQNKRKMNVDINLLIDIILAYESASVGDTENLNYSLDVANQMITKYRQLMDGIAEKASPEGEIWNLATTYI